MYTDKDLSEKKPEELVQIIKDQQTAIDSKDKEMELTVKVNNELTAQVEELSKNVPAASQPDSTTGISKETFTVDKKKYGFKLLRINYKDQIITADEVLASKELQAELVDIKSGMIGLVS